MIHSKVFTLFVGLVSTGSGVCLLAGRRETVQPTVPSATHSDWQASAFLGPSLGPGTLVSSHSYPLITHQAGHVSQLFFQADQQVHKGDVLVKLSNQTFVLAPAAGVITQCLVESGDYLPSGAPIARFTELGSLRLRLRRDSVHGELRRGQYLQVRSTQQPTSGLTATVVNTVTKDAFLLVDLRLRTSSAVPLLSGAPVKVHALRL